MKMLLRKKQNACFGFSVGGKIADLVKMVMYIVYAVAERKLSLFCFADPSQGGELKLP